MGQPTEVRILDVSEPAGMAQLTEHLREGWQLLQVVAAPLLAEDAASASIHSQVRQVAWLTRCQNEPTDATRSLSARLDETVLETVRQRGAAIQASTGNRPRPGKATLADLIGRLKDSFSAEEVRQSITRLAASGRLTLGSEIQDAHSRADILLVLPDITQ